jgi:hypothetical protein
MVRQRIRITHPCTISLMIVLGLTILVGSAAHAQAPVPYPRIETRGHTATIKRLAVDRAERWVVTASDDKTARVWDLQTGQLGRILRPPIGEGPEGRLYAVALSPDGTRVALGGFTGAAGSPDPIYLFDRASGRLVGRSEGFGSVTNHLSFSPDGARLAAVFGSGVGLRILDAADLTRELARDEDCKAAGYGADFNRAGRLVTTCHDGFLRLYDTQGQRIAKRKVERRLRHPRRRGCGRAAAQGAPGVYREVDAKVLTRRDDTGLARIDAELQALVKRAKPEDVVVIFLAGHGKAPEGQYHFIPADFIYDSDQAFNRGKTLSHARLETMLKDLGAGKRLLILDTCDSGAATHGRDGETEQKDALVILMRRTGRYILAAASPQGKALEDGVQGHGVYTYALLEGLAGAAGPRNGLIEVDALAEYLTRRVPELTAKAGYQQRPMRSAQGENFPIVRSVANSANP